MHFKLFIQNNLKYLTKFIYKNYKMDIQKLKPVIFILGATGTGKSKLGIEIARKFNGEIISADSMQLYKGLDITTNKVTTEEQAEIKHHMIDVKDPLDTFTVVEFRDESLPIIDNLHQHGKLPVIVGGTHYYAESLLWNVLIQTKKQFETKHTNIRYEHLSNDAEKNISDVNETQQLMSYYNNLSNEEILQKLYEIDPDIASGYHPNNKRKILRSLEVWHQTGVCHSTHIKQQLDNAGEHDLGGSIRFPNAIVLWITCDETYLHKRLDSRVDVMMNQGMLKEISEFHKKYSPVIDDETQDDDKLKEHYTRGIFQNIGLKEFHLYLSLSDAEKQTDKGLSLYEEAVNNMKLRTRQYSRKQNKWMRCRFLERKRQRIPVYSLDGTNLEEWNKKVNFPAINIVEHVLAGKEIPYAKVETNTVPSNTGNKTKHVCEVCDRIIIGDLQWTYHIQGTRHRRMLKLKDTSLEEKNNISPKKEAIN